MRPGRLNIQRGEQAFQIFFRSLLTMKTHRIERAIFFHRHDPVGCFKIVLSLTHPLPEDLNNLRREVVHTELYPHATQASRQCSPRSGSARSERWWTRLCPLGQESPRGMHEAPPHVCADRQLPETGPAG